MKYKYKNNTNKTMFFNIAGKWLNLSPGATIELKNRKLQERYKGLELVNDIIVEETVESLLVDMTEVELEKMTKDELNDYAAGIGFKKLNTRKSKSKMIEKILKFIEVK